MNSGDVVHLWTVSGEPGGIPMDEWDVPSELRSIWAKRCGAEDGTQPGCLDRTHCPVPHCGAPGPHVMTGPVAVHGAEPGDVLKVEILTADPWVDWGWNAIRRGKGALGNLPEFDEPGTIVMPIDLAKRTARMPWGIAAKEGDGAKAEPSETTNGESHSRKRGVEFPLNCFFGQMGVAPAPNLGEISSIQPGPHGGNLDNKDLAPGSVVYFKVNVPGAMFSAGDGHGAQVRFIFISVCTGNSLTTWFFLHLQQTGRRRILRHCAGDVDAREVQADGAQGGGVGCRDGCREGGCREGCRRGKLDVGVVDGALDVSPALGADHPAGDDELAPRHDGVSRIP